MRYFFGILSLILGFLLITTYVKKEEQRITFEEKSDSTQLKMNSVLEELYFSDSVLREYRQAYDSCQVMNARLVDYFHILIDNQNKEKRIK